MASRQQPSTAASRQVIGKRKALSVLSGSAVGHNNTLNIAASNKPQVTKGFRKADKTQNGDIKPMKGLPLATRNPQQPGNTRQPLLNIPTNEEPRLPPVFSVYCDEQPLREEPENDENARPAGHLSDQPSQNVPENFYRRSPLKARSPLRTLTPGVQQEREEEEIIVVDSPMVVDNSLGNLSLTDERVQNREFLIPEYSQEIYVYLKGVEAKLRPRVGYMRKQTDISTGMRRILVDWLVEVTQEYKLDEETLYLAVSYIDRFLSCMSVLRAKLQLVGTACMFIAAKYEEIYPPDVGEFVYITDDTYSKQQVLRMEHLVLKVLAFDLAVPTANFFLQRFCSLCGVPTVTEYLARYLCELTLLEAEPFLRFLPSEIASASLALANHALGLEMWGSEIQLVTGYVEEDFRDCLECLYKTYLEASTCPQQAIQEKYRNHRFHCVSSITPPPSLPPC